MNTFNSCLYTLLAIYMSTNCNINSTLYNLENKGDMLALPASSPRTPIRKRQGLAAFGSTEVKGDTVSTLSQPYILRVIPGCY
jgi:hypothetical protein